MAREASALTKAVRLLLVKSKGKATASEMLPQLKEQGFENPDLHSITQVKANWVATQKKSAGALSSDKTQEAETTEDEALAFIRQNGGLKAAKQLVEKQANLIQIAEKIIADLA